MKFCPKCEVRLKRGGSGLACPRCGHSEAQEARPAAAAARQDVPDLNVLEGTEGREALPTIKIDCEKCGHGEAVWWMLQTRSADEPTTQFYRCTECGHTWRNYA